MHEKAYRFPEIARHVDKTKAQHSKFVKSIRLCSMYGPRTTICKPASGLDTSAGETYVGLLSDSCN